MISRTFEEALHNFTADVAYVKDVRHLYDRGLSVDEIIANCTYPVNEAKVNKVIEDYEKEKAQGKSRTRFIEDVDAYGRKSFRKVSGENK